jgi:hypothetical protein
MKKRIFTSAFFIITLIQLATAQITNTFPLDDSVGIGTTDPVRLLDVRGPILVNELEIGNNPAGGNIAFGLALTSNTTGTFNTGIGLFTLSDNTTGGYNTAVGHFSLEFNTIGERNLAFGVGALSDNVAGNDNTAVGGSALQSNKNSSYNTAIGNLSMFESFKGDYCTAMGYLSLTNNTKGDFNTAVGVQALDANTSGNNNTALGYNADASANNFSNATVIGANAMVDASNKVRIGNSSITSNGGQVEWTAYSDARIKTNIQDNVPGLEFINLLKPVTYHFDVDKQNQLQNIYSSEKQDGMYDIEKIQWTGFLAQDVEAAAKKINYDFSGVDKSGELMGLRYSSFVVPLVQAVQELSKQNENLQLENSVKSDKIESLEQRISKLEKRITKQGIVLSDELESESSKTQIVLQSDAQQQASLAQNIPNPFTGKTNISYFVPLSASSAQIKIANANGQSLFFADIKLGSGVLEIDATQLAAGTYSYTLIIDGKVIDTKLMVIAK